MMKRYVMAIDPGLTTGFAFVDTDGPTIIETAEVDWFDLGMKQGEYLTQFPGEVAVVIERFIITPQTAKNAQAPWSLELIGQSRWVARRCGIPELIMQSPTDAKNFSTNEKLKALGLWHRGGGGHAMDALRHALLYMVRNGYNDRRLLG